ncbi:MAG: right-handed parallel beta-helix repeat-containing protein [Planctomycetales bacterium]|nr:right-handed parallel beta-helix repeat-containing protein [Planctomycetales bacterium]
MTHRSVLTLACLSALSLGIAAWLPVGADPIQRPVASSPLAEFGVVGDGKADDTAALQRAIDSGRGDVRLAKGVYRLTSPLVVKLDEVGPTSIHGGGVATLRMEGAGPAIRVVGTHFKSADPGGFEPQVWERQRMPLVDGVAITGTHPEADGIEAEGTMQLTVTRVHIRKCRHAIHLVRNNRNVIIADSHLYENSGIGVFYDDVNLHQSNITNCHISYNADGGVVSKAGNVRNLHISGCDLESNMGADRPPTANVLIDCRGSNYGTAEVAITGCTIQHNSQGPDSANVRIIGNSDPTEQLPHVREGHVTISGNVFSDVAVNVHLRECRGVTLTGNTFWMGYQHNLLIERCSHVVIGANNLDRNPRYAYGTAKTTRNIVAIDDCEDCTINGLHVAGTQGGPSVAIRRGKRLNIHGCTILDADGTALLLDELTGCRIGDMLIDGNSGKPQVVIQGGGKNVLDDSVTSLAK